MNKIIFTSDRLFMSVVGPGGSGKTRLFFSMLASKTFRPSFKKTFYFYKEYQPLFNEMAKKLNIVCSLSRFQHDQEVRGLLTSFR